MALAKHRFDKELEAARRRRLLTDALIAGELADMSLRDMAQYLAAGRGEKRSVNAEGEPWSHQTIANDIGAIEADWRSQSARDVAHLKAKQLRRYEALLVVAMKRAPHNVSWAAEARGIINSMVKLTGADQEQVRVYEAVNYEMNMVFNRLEAGLADQPELLKRVIGLIIGSEQAARQKKITN